MKDFVKKKKIHKIILQEILAIIFWLCRTILELKLESYYF